MIEKWRKQLGITNISIAGINLGGYFATDYALKY